MSSPMSSLAVFLSAVRGPGFIDRIEAEGSAILGALGSPFTWLYMAALISVLIGSWWLRRLISRLDMIAQQVRTLAISVISALTLVLAIGVSLVFLHRQAPLTSALAVIVLGVIATIAFAIDSRGWVRAAVALWRGRIRVGDRLDMGDVNGRVEDVGLFRVIIENDDGGRTHIPTARFGHAIFTVSSPERVFPVEIHIVVEHRLTETDLETLRRIAVLSPYREHESAIVIEPSSDPTRALVRFRSWSEDGARLARTHLSTSFATYKRAA
jgi:small-conductance mechanosensitive channel